MISWFAQIGQNAAAMIALAAVCLLGSSAVSSAATIDTVRARGYLICGVAEGAPGFSQVDDRGVWTGLDVDFCAALATAIFGRKDAVKFRALSAAERFSNLKSGDVDILARSATWTLSRDTDLGARFVSALFYDGLGLLVRRSQGVASVLELSGAMICVSAGGPARQQLEEYFSQRGMKFTAVPFERWNEAIQAYQNKRCTALAADVSALALVRATLGNIADNQILPETMSKEPLGPVVRLGDEHWFGIVRWVLFALVAAEEYGLTPATVDAGRSSHLTEVRRLLGTDGDLGTSLGLSRDWAYQLIKQVGNYGEIYERNIGLRSALKLERGVNSLWSKGGLMYAPPFR
jgi:general L-amino acid transport system substrate-binding protein